MGSGALLALAVPLFPDADLTVEKTVVVQASEDTVWELVVDLERHPDWHPWDLADSSPRLVFGQTRRGLDASYFWIGARDNHGMLRYTRVDERRREVEGILDLASLGASRIEFRFTPVEAGVKVTEIFNRPAGLNLFKRSLHPLYRAKVERQLGGNLARLKAAAERSSRTATVPESPP